MSENNQPQGQAQNAPIKKPWYKKWWVITIGVIVILIIIGNSGKDKNNDGSKQTSSESKSETTAKKEDQPAVPDKLVPEIIVTSINLSKEYSDNEVASDAKYKGKIIEVSGKITAIDNGIADNEIIIRLSDGIYDMSTTMCYMNESERDKAIALKKEQQVTLIGKGASATLKSPVLKDCIIK